MALKSPKLRQKALDFSTQAGEIITRTLQESNLPRHAQNALESMLGKNLSQMLDSRKWINDPAQVAKNFKNTTQALLKKVAKGKSDIMLQKNPNRDAKMENQRLRSRLDEATKSEVIDLPPKNFKNPKQFSALLIA